MTENLQTVIAAMRKIKARQTTFEASTVRAGTGKEAFVSPPLPFVDAKNFISKYEAFVRDEDVTLFRRSMRSVKKGKQDLKSEIWLILDSSVELQFDILERFAVGDSFLKGSTPFFLDSLLRPETFDLKATVTSVMDDMRRILQLVSHHTDFLVTEVHPATAIVRFRSHVDSKTLDYFFGEVIAFMRKYHRFELTEKAWKKMFLQNQSIIL